VYKALHKLSLDHICDLIQPYTASRSLRFCNQLLLSVSRSHCKSKGDRAFSLHCKKIFSRLLSQHIFFCQINFIIIYLIAITYYFEFLMIKLISFIVLTHFFQFNQLKILRQSRLLTFLIKPTIFFTVKCFNIGILE